MFVVVIFVLNTLVEDIFVTISFVIKALALVIPIDAFNVEVEILVVLRLGIVPLVVTSIFIACKSPLNPPPPFTINAPVDILVEATVEPTSKDFPMLIPPNVIIDPPTVGPVASDVLFI